MTPSRLLEAMQSLCIHTFHSTPGLIQRPNRWWIVDESYSPQEDDEDRHLILGTQNGYASREEAELARAQLILERIGLNELIVEMVEDVRASLQA